MLNIVDQYSADNTVETEEGVVAIEYVLLAALVAIVVVGLSAAFGGLSGRLSSVISTVVS